MTDVKSSTTHDHHVLLADKADRQQHHNHGASVGANRSRYESNPTGANADL